MNTYAADARGARGVLHIHSAPTALCPHVEWAVASLVDTRVDFDWAQQPAAPERAAQS